MNAPAVLLIVDFFNPTSYEGMGDIAAPVLRAAQRVAALKVRLRDHGIPAIYANDNFGHWESEFSALVSQCCKLRGVAGKVASVLGPGREDWSLLKPRHSAFYGTPLEFMLEQIGARWLILAGVAADSCITMTAHDAYVRQFNVWVPRDCVASGSAAHTRAALTQLQRVVDALTVPSSARTLPRLD